MGWIVFLYPLMELWSLIELGAQTTAGTAVLWVLVAGLVGLGAIRFAGTQVLTRLQAASREGALQQHLLAGDMALAFAGWAHVQKCMWPVGCCSPPCLLCGKCESLQYQAPWAVGAPASCGVRMRRCPADQCG